MRKPEKSDVKVVRASIKERKLVKGIVQGKECATGREGVGVC